MKLRKGLKIFLMQIYIKSANEDFEDVQSYIYYWDGPRRYIFEEEGSNITPLMKQRGDIIPDGVDYYETWVSKKEERSIQELIDRTTLGFNRFHRLFAEYEINITEIGEL